MPSSVHDMAVQALPVSKLRRRFLYAGVAGMAAACGAGWAWWKLSPQTVQPDILQTLWSLEFETPAGPPMVLRAFVGKPLLLNFWATWCPPCVQELPMLDAFYRDQSPKGWQVIGLAIDQPSSVRAFLARVPLEFPVGLAERGGIQLARSLGNLTGGLPFTAIVSADGRNVYRKMGQATASDLQLWVQLK